MCNYGAVTSGIESGGKSSFWSKSGELLAGFPFTGKGMIISSKKKWIMDSQSTRDR